MGEEEGAGVNDGAARESIGGGGGSRDEEACSD